MKRSSFDPPPGRIVFASALLAACGSNSINPPGVLTPANTATLNVSTTPQSLPATNGATASVALAVATGTPASPSLLVTASNAPPVGIAALSSNRQALSGTRTQLAYYMFVPSVDLQFTSFPSFTITFPSALFAAGTTIHEAFLDASTAQPVYAYDVAVGANGTTLTSSSGIPKLLAGKTYVFAFYYESSSPLPSSSPSATPSTTPSASPPPTPTASPVPTATPTAAPASGSATFSGFAPNYSGLTTPISGFDTTESGGNGNVVFSSVPHGQAGTGVDATRPNRKIILEINDNTPISNASSYGNADFTNTKVLFYYQEDWGSGSRWWVANGGTATFTGVANGQATYHVRATMTVDPFLTSNLALGTFTLDAVATANPFKQ